MCVCEGGGGADLWQLFSLHCKTCCCWCWCRVHVVCQSRVYATTWLAETGCGAGRSQNLRTSLSRQTSDFLTGFWRRRRRNVGGGGGGGGEEEEKKGGFGGGGAICAYCHFYSRHVHCSLRVWQNSECQTSARGALPQAPEVGQTYDTVKHAISSKVVGT